MLLFILTFCAKISIAIINRYADSGHPSFNLLYCLIVSEKKHCLLFYTLDYYTLLFIQLIKESPKLKYSKHL